MFCWQDCRVKSRKRREMLRMSHDSYLRDRENEDMSTYNSGSHDWILARNRIGTVCDFFVSGWFDADVWSYQTCCIFIFLLYVWPFFLKTFFHSFNSTFLHFKTLFVRFFSLKFLPFSTVFSSFEPFFSLPFSHLQFF